MKEESIKNYDSIYSELIDKCNLFSEVTTFLCENGKEELAHKLNRTFMTSSCLIPDEITNELNSFSSKYYKLVTNMNPKKHDLVLNNQINQKIKNCIKMYQSKTDSSMKGIRYINKLLLFGPSGCGKSLVAENIAHDVSMPILYGSIDKLLSSKIEDTILRINDLFKQASKTSCVLLIENIDILCNKEHQSMNTYSYLSTLVEQHINNLDDKTFIIATTSNYDQLDCKVSSIFTNKILLDYPGYDDIQKLLYHGSVNKYREILGNHGALRIVIRSLLGLSHRDIKNILHYSIAINITNNHKYITYNEIMNTIYLFYNPAATIYDKVMLLKKQGCNDTLLNVEFKIPRKIIRSINRNEDNLLIHVSDC